LGFLDDAIVSRCGKRLESAVQLRPWPPIKFYGFAVEVTLTLRKYLVILSVVFFGSVGDAFLARGMKHAGAIDIHHLTNVFSVLANPFIIVGIVFLLAFMFSYMTALSFADLTYVLPATAISYVVMVLLSIFWLHESVTPQRWAGVAFIVVGVGVVAGGPSRTEHPPSRVSAKAVEERV
jgi:drug/metabolite transporter (DMT)-like permease